MQREQVYIGTMLMAFVATNPLIAQVVLLPLDHGAMRAEMPLSSFGEAKGPSMMAKDWKMSEQLMPNTIRR